MSFNSGPARFSWCSARVMCGFLRCKNLPTASRAAPLCSVVNSAHREFDLSILHPQVQSGRLQVPVSAAVVNQGHKPAQVQLLHVLCGGRRTDQPLSTVNKGPCQPAAPNCQPDLVPGMIFKLQLLKTRLEERKD